MRTLYYVPMVHTPQELGTLREAVIANHKRIHGEQQTEEYFKQVEWYWREVERRIQQAGLYRPEIVSRLHIFVDGLPDTKEEKVKKIVQELIGLDIPAYRITEKLQARGAEVHGTEDPQLLWQEHQYWAGVSQDRKQDPRGQQRLLRERDQAIAQRIDAKVKERGISLLFIGRAHNVVGELAKLSRDFKVIYL